MYLIRNPKLFGISITLRSIAWAGLFLSVVYALFEMFYEGNSSIHAENHFLENAQVAACVLAMLVFLGAAFAGGEKAKAIPLFFAVLAFAFILRELDVERLDLPKFCRDLGSGIGRNILVSALFVGVFAMAFLKFKFYLNAAFKFMRMRAFYWGVMAAAVLLLSDITERTHPVSHYEFWEETLELAGYTLFLIAATYMLPHPVEGRS